jgi:hypothetical protein
MLVESPSSSNPSTSELRPLCHAVMAISCPEPPFPTNVPPEASSALQVRDAHGPTQASRPTVAKTLRMLLISLSILAGRPVHLRPLRDFRSGSQELP